VSHYRDLALLNNLVVDVTYDAIPD